MSHLLDVNLLLACAWSGHAEHVRANRWLNSLTEFSTAPVTQMGFLRVSMSVAYGASFGDAQTALRAILQLKSHRFLTDAVPADSLPALSSGQDVTDAHLVRLADSQGLKLATLDGGLCKKQWAARIAENPL
ncbi:MAG: PIN domain nuclease [Verrucomicrobia bacterium]|nr:PIN domain nuclease [Verrucomicrobiota bacterium]